MKFKTKKRIQLITFLLAICLTPTLFGILRFLHECKPETPVRVTIRPIFDDLLDAMCTVESSNNEIAIGLDGERGILQLSEIYIDDVNKILGPSFAHGGDIYEYTDAFNPLFSRMMTEHYLKYYLNHYAKEKPLEMSSFEMAARIHNGGPQGWKKKSTLPYWEKVLAKLYKAR